MTPSSAATEGTSRASRTSSATSPTPASPPSGAPPLLEDDEPTSSYHGYACTDYYQIDPRFGSNWKYREMVAQAHEHGIKVIMDIVTNHCGDRHWWMEDLPFQDWIHQWPSTPSNCAFSAQNDPYCSELDRINMTSGWFDTSMVDMNLDNPWLLQYFKQWAVWWIEWADLDGFRVDTYPYNEKVPMSEWCKAVRTEYPNFNIVGEVWSGNVPEVAYWQAENPNRDGFNSNLPSIMDFPCSTRSPPESTPTARAGTRASPRYTTRLPTTSTTRTRRT